MSGTGRSTDEFVALRTDPEREAFGAAVHYSRTHAARLAEESRRPANPDPRPAEAAYLEAIEPARREMLYRLVRGLLRGDPEGLAGYRLVRPDAPSIPNGPEPLEALSPERLRSLAPEACRRLALLPFPAAEGVLIAGIVAVHGYDRFRFDGPVLLWSPAGRETVPDDPDATTEAHVRPITHPVDLVPLLECEGAFADAEQAERIRSELAESVANLALAALARRVHASQIEVGTNASGEDGAASDGGDSSSASSLERIAAGIPAADSAVAFERIVTDGHPFHPAAKIRRGMTAAEGLAYAPEFTDRIDVRFVAVDRERALETSANGDDRLTARLFETFGGLEDDLEGALPRGRASEEFAVVPIHPLQYHRTIPKRYRDRVDDGAVVPLEYAHPATPLLNLRTVVPHETDRTADGPLPHLKLAVPVQTTNVVRTVSPHAVWNGPQVTDLARAIERRESLETLGLVAEPAATCYHGPDGPHPSGPAFDDARHLSGLLRTNPAAHPLVPDGAIPVVASSLVADDPATGRPLVCELIDRYGERHLDGASADEAALAFLDDYAAAVVPEQLRLLSAYGVALESHLQNSLVVFDPDDARPIATLVRDFGGIRVLEDRLAERDLSIEPYPDSDLDADEVVDLHEKLYYALFQNHLAELVATIVHEFGVEEDACWALVRERCQRAFEALRADSAVPDERIERDERALFADSAVHKALTAMRLRGKRHEYVRSAVSNPLAGVER